MAPKGSGSENMSKMQMFYPAHGVKALKKFVLDAVIESGGNPCASRSHWSGNWRYR